MDRAHRGAHGPDQALGLADPLAVVDPALVLHQEREVARSGGQRDGEGVRAAVEHADLLVVDQDDGAVTHLAQGQHQVVGPDPGAVDREARPEAQVVGRRRRREGEQVLAQQARQRVGQRHLSGQVDLQHRRPRPSPSASLDLRGERRHRQVPRDHVAHRVVLGGRCAVLGQRRVVVVRRRDGPVDALVVRAAGQAEVGAAVEHVQVHRPAGREQVVQVGGVRLGGCDVVLQAPRVEPAVPELHAHERSRGLVPPQDLQPLRAARAERRRLVQLRQAAASQHLVVGLVAGEQGYLDALLTGQVNERPEVLLPLGQRVVPVGAVLVLHLDHEHGPAACHLALGHQGQQVRVIGADRREEPRLVPAHPHLGVGEQPAGQPAAVPLGADVGSRPHDRVQALGGHQVEEPPEVAPPGQVEHVGVGRVEVPRHVRLDGVQAHEPSLADPVGPLVGVHAEVVQRAADDLHRAAVELEVLGADVERGHVCVLRGGLRVLGVGQEDDGGGRPPPSSLVDQPRLTRRR